MASNRSRLETLERNMGGNLNARQPYESLEETEKWVQEVISAPDIAFTPEELEAQPDDDLTLRWLKGAILSHRQKKQYD